MKKIIFVRNLNSQEDVEKIKFALIENRASIEVDLARKAVIVEGNNDVLYSVKIHLREAGFIVE